MKVEGWIFAGIAIFLGLVTVLYWFVSYDPTGTAALTLTVGLCVLIAFYLLYTGKKLPARPEDRKDAEIHEGAGELGFFSPHSVWPLYVGLSVALAAAGVAIGWWLFIIALIPLVISVCLFVFEYYRKAAYQGTTQH